ncbi:MAG: DMT family transporter [Ruminococcaceae bacterium]|nr:DMT family transporter [Oscillospiraceae bacterium]
MKNKLIGNVYLIIAVLIWGSTFIAQSVGMDSIGPFTFLAVRCFLAVAFLLPVIALFEWKERKHYFRKWKDKKLWIAGFFCGLSLFVASALQQISLVDTDAGKAGFLTSLYVVLVPVIGLFLGKKPTGNMVISILLAVAGLYLLSCTGLTAIRPSDLLLLGSALSFAVQITLVERLGKDLDGLRLNTIQCLVAGLLASVFMVFVEEPTVAAVLSCYIPLLYAGILSNGIAYSMQVLGQQYVESNTASIIMSMEGVVAAVCGWLILQEQMTSWELLGCGLVLTAVILSQIPLKRKK